MEEFNPRQGRKGLERTGITPGIWLAGMPGRSNKSEGAGKDRDYPGAGSAGAALPVCDPGAGSAGAALPVCDPGAGRRVLMRRNWLRNRICPPPGTEPDPSRELETPPACGP